MWLCQSQLPSLSLSPFSLVTICLFSTSVTLFLFVNTWLCTSVLDSTYKWYHMMLCDICLSFYDLFHPVWWSLGLPMLLQMALFSSWLSNVLLCISTISSLFIHLSMYIYVFSVSWRFFPSNFWIRLFSYCWVLSILCLFCMTVLYQTCLLLVFSPHLWLVFSFSWHYLRRAKGFHFNEIQLISNFFHGLCL